MAGEEVGPKAVGEAQEIILSYLKLGTHGAVTAHFPLSSAPGKCHLTFYFYELDCLRYFI